ncbi:MAG TPA: isochorismatase family cysteine hydrolase [Dehalococcoidia bacterium]
MSKQPAVDPSRTAVVVVDVQRAFTDLLGESLSPPLGEVLPNITRFLTGAREVGATVFLVRIIVAPDEHSSNTLIWPESLREQLRPGAAGTEWDPCIAPGAGDIEVVKQRYSSFFGTNLDAMLRERDIETVVNCGLTTNVCVQSTVRDCWQRDYQTITVSDCCSESGEGAHSSALLSIARNFGRVHRSETILKMWRS